MSSVLGCLWLCGLGLGVPICKRNDSDLGLVKPPDRLWVEVSQDPLSVRDAGSLRDGQSYSLLRLTVCHTPPPLLGAWIL